MDCPLEKIKVQCKTEFSKGETFPSKLQREADKYNNLSNVKIISQTAIKP